MLRRLGSRDIKDCDILARPGKTFRTLKFDIQAGRICLKDYSVIGLLVGTNDIDNMVYCRFGAVGYKVRRKNHHAPNRHVNIDSVKADFHDLINVVRSVNDKAVLVLVAVIPRLGDWQWSKEYAIQVNDMMQRWCCAEVEKGKNTIFAPIYKGFIKGGVPDRRFYARDEIHLSVLGISRLRHFLRMAMSNDNIKKGGSWKRQPLGWGQPSGKRRRVQVGNLVTYV